MIKVIKSYLGISLPKRILIAVVLGIAFGIFLQFHPDTLKVIGISADGVKSIGLLYINLIKMLIAPLIFASISAAIISLNHQTGIGKLAGKSILFFTITTLFAVILGVILAANVKPGVGVYIDTESLISSNQVMIDSIKSNMNKSKTISDFFYNIVPDNVVKTFSGSNFIQIIFFSVIFAIGLRKTHPGENVLKDFIKSLDKTITFLSKNFSEFAPIAIFSFVAWLVATQKMELIQALGKIILIVYGGIFFLVYLVYGLCLLCLGLNPIHFYRKIIRNQVTGYFLDSTAAMIPANIEVLEKRLGVSSEKARFIIPLSATLNMNGSAFNLGVSTVFIAQLWGVNFSLDQYAMLVLTVMLGSLGTAPIPGSSIFLLAGILAMVGLPVEAIGIIMAIDRLLDMARTLCNFSGDLFVAVAIDHLDKTLNKKQYASK